MLTAEEHAAWWRRDGEAQLRELLYRRWDPIGLAADHLPQTRDEYDDYALGVLAVLRRSEGDAAAVGAELTRVEVEDLGLAPRDDGRTAAAAEAIAAWYRAAALS